MIRVFSRVVFPAWVPPATMMFSPAVTAASRNRAACAVIVPSATRSSSPFAATTNLRMFRLRCSRVMSGMTACSRLPSGSSASTNGDDRSSRRPEGLSIRSTRSRTSLGGQHNGGELGAAVAGDEHPARLVDPDLLDRGIVQKALQRAESGQRVEDVTDGAGPVEQRRQGRDRDPLVVVGDHLVDQQPGRPVVGHRVDAAPPDQFADLVVDVFGGGGRDHRPGPPGSDGGEEFRTTVTRPRATTARFCTGETPRTRCRSAPVTGCQNQQMSGIRTAQCNGITLAYETFGDPDDVPILLVMGLGTQMLAWPDEFCAMLVERGHYVVRFDNRDMGLSTHFDDAATAQPVAAFLGRRPLYLLTDMAADTAGLIDRARLAQCPCRRRLDGRLHQSGTDPGAPGPGPQPDLDVIEHRVPPGRPPAVRHRRDG